MSHLVPGCRHNDEHIRAALGARGRALKGGESVKGSLFFGMPSTWWGLPSRPPTQHLPFSPGFTTRCKYDVDAL